ncbi:Ig domain-containing protein, partial [Ottowia thiooxydans]
MEEEHRARNKPEAQGFQPTLHMVQYLLRAVRHGALTLLALFAVSTAWAQLTVAPPTLPNATQGTAYTQTLTASGAPGPYSFALTAGSFPLGMSFNSAGVLSGTPTVAGTFNFIVTVNGAAGSIGSRAYAFVVDPPPALAITPLTLPNATQGTAYTQTLTASGAPGPYSFALTAGSFPLGMSFNSVGVLSGTPTVPGTFNFTVTADNGAAGSTGSRAYSFVVDPPPALAITPLTLPNATQGTAYTQTLTASGAPGPYSFALTAGSFPLGMSFNSVGVLSGTPTVPGTFNFTVTADNGAAGSTGSRA